MAVEIGKDLKIKKAFPVIELHNFIFRSKKKSLMELIVNNAFNAGIVLSDKKIAKPLNQWDKSKHLILKVNGKIMQNSNTSDMIFDVSTLISFLSGSTNIRNRTLILTGTPQGIGYSRIPPVFMKEGDEVIIEIDKIGSLTNKIIKES